VEACVEVGVMVRVKVRVVWVVVAWEMRNPDTHHIECHK